MAVIPGDPSVKDPTKASYAAGVNDALADINARVSATETSLLSNGSFEFDLDIDGEPDAWTVTDSSGGSHAISDLNDSGGNARHGAKSLQIITTNAGGRADALSDNFIPIGRDNVVLVDGYTQRDTNGIRVRVEIQYFDETETIVSTDTLFDDSGASVTWDYHGLRSEVPIGAFFYKVRLRGGESAGVIAGNVYFDGFTSQSQVTGVSYIGRNELKTGSNVTTQSVGTGVLLNIVMDDYSFFPNVHSVGTDFPLETQSVTSTGTTPRFSIRNNTGASITITVRWLYITASDGPRFGVFKDNDGKVKCLTEYDDAPPVWRDRCDMMAEANGWTWTEVEEAVFLETTLD